MSLLLYTIITCSSSQLVPCLDHQVEQLSQNIVLLKPHIDLEISLVKTTFQTPKTSMPIVGEARFPV